MEEGRGVEVLQFGLTDADGHWDGEGGGVLELAEGATVHAVEVGADGGAGGEAEKAGGRRGGEVVFEEEGTDWGLQGGA